MSHPIVTEAQAKMKKAVDHTLHEFSAIHTGKATPTMVENVMVEAYGQRMPLNQVGTVSAPEPRLLAVNVWDKGLVTPTAKAIRDAGLGLNPQPDGQMIRIPLP